ncbi:hypothetical protein AVEN_148041-1 [Araneus ventricosus]|uniref:Uncharacterized protein n=1 Tax=Araneus ventricosus TaxID=182803 RepID=A0A4Y2PEM9_ARAVE|nr:hypothetical protein AVEN_148041-1 [Araneus ventricosus]
MAGLHFPLADLMTRPLAVTGPHVCLALWSSGSNWATSCFPIFRVWNLMLSERHYQSECIKLRNTWILKKMEGFVSSPVICDIRKERFLKTFSVLNTINAVHAFGLRVFTFGHK